MNSRTGLIRRLRKSLEDEALREGKPKDHAVRYATQEIEKHKLELSNRRVLRLVAAEC